MNLRLREFSLAIWALTFFVTMLPADRRRRAHALVRRTKDVLGHRGFFPISTAALTLLFVAAVVSRHLAFRTFSHDFSMIDEALHSAHTGRGMFSPLLGRSFLSEHFSPILFLIAPLHAVWCGPIPWLLAPPLALIGAGLVLRALLRAEGHPVWLANLALVLWIENPIVVRTAEYAGHMESFLPGLLFGALLAWRKQRGAIAGLLLLGALAVKEDVGIYVAGLGAWLAIAERRRGLGLTIAAIGLIWTLGALRVMPLLADGREYGFLSRWSRWGEDIPGILASWATRPHEVVASMLRQETIRLFACLGFLPLMTASGWLLVLAPWVLNTTSDHEQQANLGIYYGLPLLAFATLAAVAGLRSPALRRLATPRVAPAFAAALVILNLAHHTFPVPARDRDRFLAAIEMNVPVDARVQAMSCFFPVLGYERTKVLLEPGDLLEEPWAVIRTRDSTWPYRGADAEALLRDAAASGDYLIVAEGGGCALLRRALASPAASSTGTSMEDRFR